MEAGYRDDQRHGAWTGWYPNGDRREYMEYRAGEHHGKSARWHENGQLGQRGEWRNGEECGTWECWSDDGQSELCPELLQDLPPCGKK